MSSSIPNHPITGHIEAVAPARGRRRRRRPSGEPPPLPRSLQSSGRLALALFGCIFGLLLTVAIVGNFDTYIDKFDTAILRFIARFRSGGLTTVMKSFVDDVLTSDWTIGVLRWAAVIGLIAFKRFRHLLVFLGSLLAVGWVTTNIALIFVRSRPIGIEIIGDWEGSSIPSRPIASLAATLIGITYSFFPAGRSRDWAKWTTWGILSVFAAARLYLGVDHLTDVVFGLIFGIGIPLVAFRVFVPNEVFPVRYRKGRAAHLDITGPRGDAIRMALDEQLGIHIVDMKPFGLGGSGGSTPMKLTVEGPPHHLFAKLYAANHLRADRWYKLGRTLLYGRLEDEGSFNTVRRLVQYEDYMLRVMRDGGLKTPLPQGIAEITPEREYVIVMTFVDGAQEILEAEVDEAVIDSALAAIRALWDAGIAHRDVKPSNVLVRDKEVFLIDVAFGEIRPSPWRQAVDLANMMLVLALRDDPDRVYQRALAFFTPDEIAEAFAATHSVTMPSQSRSMLKEQLKGKDQKILKRFRELAPPHPKIRIQRWSLRRLGLTFGVLMALIVALSIGVGNLQGAALIPPQSGTLASFGAVIMPPECETLHGGVLVLEGQAVPSASHLLCLESLPLGWTYRSMDVHEGRARMYLVPDRAESRTVEITLTRSCDVSSATKVPTDEVGTERYELVRSLDSGYAGTRFYVFPGGCATYRFDFAGRPRADLVNEASLAVGFITREDVVERYKKLSGGVDPL